MKRSMLLSIKGVQLLRRFVFIAYAFVSINAWAIEVETVPQLVDENRVMSSAKELHITSADAPFVNSTVSLDHEDAWLFFDNIKPSTVIGNYLGSVLVNGSPFVNGTNGRVAIYGHGAVLMPNSSSFKPLTVFTENDFTGQTTQYAIHTYYSALGDFDNAIKSFKLKRGYMATFANESDGSGYSRVFIADEEDLEFSLMPAELYGAVSFIRVFKHQWTNKKGKAGWDPHILNGTCYYDWNVGGNSSDDVEYSVIRQNGGWPSFTDINNKQNVTHLLGFNEPDRPDQANMSFDDMIAQWPEFMKSGLRIGSPAWSSEWNGAPNGGGNLFDFVDKCDELNYRLDFVALHCYWAKSPTQWYNDLKYIYERTGRPLWITEWNNGANWTTEWWPDADRTYTEANAQKQLNDMMGILQVLDTAHFVERYFIYDWVQDCRAMVLNDQLTLAGEYYANNPSEIAYDNSNDVIPGWTYSVPEVSYRYLSLSNMIKVSWVDDNLELSRGYKLEKKQNDGIYEAIFETDDSSILTYSDPLDPAQSGKITYRVSLKTIDGDYIASNEVSYFQTGGSATFQTGNLEVDNTDWTSCYFSEKFAQAPMVILGAPTFNNVLAISKRVNNTLTNSFKFHLDPWNYITNPTFSNTDRMAVMALPKGTYDFAGLKAEAGELTGLQRDWVTVSFTEAFETVPVVFCTQVSNANSYPTSVAIQNVTTTGFEVCIKTEEAITGILIGEKINFLAIEEGNGVINDKRITVGTSADGEGITSTPLIVNYDATYIDPVVFGTLLTTANTFASTVRYYDGGENKFKILRQREMSAGASPIAQDKLGWIIMDISPDQVITDVNDKMIKPVSYYPNPVTDILTFQLQKETRVQIFNLSGQKLIDSVVQNQLDLSQLLPGMYLIKIGNSGIEKIVKK